MRYEIRMVMSFIVFATLAAISGCGHPPVVEAPKSAIIQTSRNAQQTRMPGEYLVTLVAGENESAVSERYARFGIKSIQALGNNTFLLRISDDVGLDGVRAVVEQDTRFKAVQPNFIYRANQPRRNLE